MSTSDLVKPRVEQRIAIIGPYGNIWTPDTFDTPEEAEAHLRAWWKGVPSFDITQWQYAPVTVTLEMMTLPMAPVGPWPFTALRRAEGA